LSPVHFSQVYRFVFSGRQNSTQYRYTFHNFLLPEHLKNVCRYVKNFLNFFLLTVYRFAGLNFLVTCFFPLKSSTFIFPTTTTNTKIIQYLKLTMTSKLVFFQYPIHTIYHFLNLVYKHPSLIWSISTKLNSSSLVITEKSDIFLNNVSFVNSSNSTQLVLHDNGNLVFGNWSSFWKLKLFQIIKNSGLLILKFQFQLIVIFILLGLIM
jgi:hypothetical protein